MPKRGRFIVIEGLDSSGKHTQALLLKSKLKGSVLVSFPNYKSAIGRLIEDYLHGRMGSKEEVPAEVAALLYAMDRYQLREKLDKMLEMGKTVIADRYTPSNLYQAAKLAGKAQAEFLVWLGELESGLPKPDAVVFLHLPAKAAQNLMRARKGKVVDMHESDVAFQEKVRKLYLLEAKRKKWLVVECLGRDGNVRAAAGIASEIAGRLLKKIGTIKPLTP